LSSVPISEKLLRWVENFGSSNPSSPKECLLESRVKAVCEKTFNGKRIDEIKIDGSDIHFGKFGAFCDGQFAKRKSFGFSDSLAPLFFINPKEIPDYLAKQCFSNIHREEFVKEFGEWVKKHFELFFFHYDTEVLKDALIYFAELWKRPEMFERVQNLLITKYILERDFSSEEGNNRIPLFIFAPLFILPVLVGFNIIGIGGFYVGIIIYCVAASILFFLKGAFDSNRNIKESDISTLRNSTDLEALKIVIKASEASAKKKDPSFFSKFIPRFLSFNLSAQDRIAYLEKYAKEHNITYLSSTSVTTDCQENVKSKNQPNIEPKDEEKEIKELGRIKKIAVWTLCCINDIVTFKGLIPIVSQIFAFARIVERDVSLLPPIVAVNMVALKLLELSNEYVKKDPEIMKKYGEDLKRYYKYIPCIPYKNIAIALGLAISCRTNVLQYASSAIRSLWASYSKVFSSKTNFTSNASAIVNANIKAPVKSIARELSLSAKAVNACVAKCGPIAKLTYQRAKEVFNCYGTFELTNAQIKRIYRKLAPLLHPDHGGINENMAILNRAKEILLQYF